MTPSAGTPGPLSALARGRTDEDGRMHHGTVRIRENHSETHYGAL